MARYITLDRRNIAKKSKKETMPGLNEAETRAELIDPAIKAAGWGGYYEVGRGGLGRGDTPAA